MKGEFGTDIRHKNATSPSQLAFVAEFPKALTFQMTVDLTHVYFVSRRFAAQKGWPRLCPTDGSGAARHCQRKVEMSGFLQSRNVRIIRLQTLE